ncbi:hypothetical protein UU9_11908 [Rhodanobacter fulvus Jip2]|uniref:Uncharacterized protein n=1 Tax=Rhodanobacter fulvus Jip2 TaxID=1163408 RepID=I4VN60_9GAMM|nr:hypothetical protein UU9_11908 [Rhodanobacter fulvus Jip2]
MKRMAKHKDKGLEIHFLRPTSLSVHQVAKLLQRPLSDLWTFFLVILFIRQPSTNMGCFSLGVYLSGLQIYLDRLAQHSVTRMGISSRSAAMMCPGQAVASIGLVKVMLVIFRGGMTVAFSKKSEW